MSGDGWQKDDDGQRIIVARLILALRRQGIRDPAVLKAVESVPREMFVPPELFGRAYDDRALPINCGQTISQPFVVAFMTEKLEVGRRDKILEIGTGSGYQAAILSRLCGRVFTVERYRTLLREATERFEALGIPNISTTLADGQDGWRRQAPFDRIMVTAACEEVPAALIEQLKDGGVMVLPVGSLNGTQHLVRIRKNGRQTNSEKLLPVRFVPLVAGKAEHL